MEELIHRYNSLEDFLISNPLTIDGVLNDGWGAYFSVKGCEIEATILFADITSFSTITQDLSSAETLIYINNFFAWISAEALRGRPGIVDKYIGDEIMVVFSNEFGSSDHFVDAVQTARWMAENDALSFCPHIGIASGPITVGYVGTPLKYDCSVFGSPVTLAARCASVKSKDAASSYIIFPAELWKGRDFGKVFPRVKYKGPCGDTKEKDQNWKMLPSRKEKIKNMPPIEVIEIAKMTIHLPGQSASERAEEALENLKKAGLYRPKI